MTYPNKYFFKKKRKVVEFIEFMLKTESFDVEDIE